MFIKIYKLVQKLIWKLTNPQIALKFNKKFVEFERLPEHYKKLKIVFVHIPKAAGMSVVKSIYGVDYSSHYTYSDYLAMEPKIKSEYFTFTLTRHPVTRLCSAYYYLKKGGKSRVDEYWKRKYIDNYVDIDDFVINGLESAIENGVEHFIPQCDFFFDKKVQVDSVVKLEEINKLSEILLQKTGVKLEFERVNSTSYKPALSEASIAKIHKIYKQDFLVCNYEE